MYQCVHLSEAFAFDIWNFVYNYVAQCQIIFDAASMYDVYASVAFLSFALYGR